MLNLKEQAGLLTPQEKNDQDQMRFVNFYTRLE